MHFPSSVRMVDYRNYNHHYNQILNLKNLKTAKVLQLSEFYK